MWLAAPLALATLFAIPAVGESLWIDELHTAWCVSGSVADALERIADGNQTSAYFLAIFALAKTLGLNHWILRGPSIAVWLATIVLLAVTFIRCRIAPARSWEGVIFLLWVVLDRIQLFYATEARPYAAVQLATLGGWLCIWLSVTEMQASNRYKWQWLWALTACTAIHLQPTAALAVAWQLMAGLVVSLSGGERSSRSWSERFAKLGTNLRTARSLILPITAVAIATSPVVMTMVPVWNRRQQWATFGSIPAWFEASDLFPVLPLLGTVLLLSIVHWLFQSYLSGSVGDVWHQAKRAGGPLREVTFLDWRVLTRKRLPTTIILFWSLAAFGPWLSGWLLAALEIAPLYHRRYLFACSIPLAILSASVLMMIRSQRARICIGVAALLMLLVQQGTLTQVWGTGQWIGTLRGEHWGPASNFISRRITENEVVWCSSQLIEGNDESFALNQRQAEYFSLPLKSLYRIQPVASSHPATVIPLLNSSQQWTEVFLDPNQRRADQGWLVLRGTAGDLKPRLERVQRTCAMSGIELQYSDLTSFGRVSVARIIFPSAIQK